MQHDVAVSTAQAAAYCRVSPSTIRRWIKNKGLTGYNISGRLRMRIRLRDLDAFVDRYHILVDEDCLHRDSFRAPWNRATRRPKRRSTETEQPAREVKEAPALDSRLLVFSLDSNSYALGVNVVEAIITIPPITEVPGAPEFMDGVVNVHNTVVPVMNLRARLGLPRCEASRGSRIVMVTVDGAKAGLMVDAVSEVLQVSEDAFTGFSSFDLLANDGFVHGMVKVDDRLVSLLGLRAVLNIKKQPTATGTRQAAPEETRGPERPEMAEPEKMEFPEPAKRENTELPDLLRVAA